LTRPNGGSASPLLDEIERRIASSGRITFCEFMELALYHPEHGYYRRKGVKTGLEGDFSTSSDVSPLFGETIAVQAAELHELLASDSWQILELGGGRGLLAADLVRGLERHAGPAREALDRVVLVESSVELAREQAARLSREHPSLEIRVAGRLEELEDRSVRGLVVANEFFDALPVHAFERTPERLTELWVELDERGGFRLAPEQISSDAAARLAERYRLCPEPGDRCETCPAIEPLLVELGRVVDAGAAIFVDYGHDAGTLGDRAHADGTLVAYSNHRVSEDLLSEPGERDLTAHVNWSHLEDAAAVAGWAPAGRVAQGRFLLALGIAEEIAAAASASDPALIARALSAKALVMPGAGAGGRFEVAAFLRGVAGELRGMGPLTGFGRT